MKFLFVCMSLCSFGGRSTVQCVFLSASLTWGPGRNINLCEHLHVYIVSDVMPAQDFQLEWVE